MLDALLQKRFFTGGKRVLVNLLRGLLYLLHRWRKKRKGKKAARPTGGEDR